MCLGIPGKVVAIDRDEARGALMGTVDFGGIRKQVCLAYVPDIALGEYTIVHVGFAITRIDEASALETLRTFEALGLLEEELAEPDLADPPAPPPCPVPAWSGAGAQGAA